MSKKSKAAQNIKLRAQFFRKKNAVVNSAILIMLFYEDNIFKLERLA